MLTGPVDGLELADCEGVVEVAPPTGVEVAPPTAEELVDVPAVEVVVAPEEDVEVEVELLSEDAGVEAIPPAVEGTLETAPIELVLDAVLTGVVAVPELELVEFDTTKLVVVEPVVKSPAAVCEAISVTVPAPVTVTVLPEIVAGPLTTEYVIAPVEFEVAEMENGFAPTVWPEMVVNAMDGVAGLTVNDVVVVVEG